MTGQHIVDPNAPITGFFQFNPVDSGFNFNDGYGGGGVTAHHGPDEIPRQGGTPVDLAAAKLSLDLLYQNSPTARVLLE